MTNTIDILKRLAKNGIPSENLVVGKEVADHCSVITGSIHDKGQEKHVLLLLWFSKIPGPLNQYDNRFTYQKLAESTEEPILVDTYYELPRPNNDDPVVIAIKINTGREFYFSLKEYKVLPEKPVFIKKRQYDHSWR